LWLKRTGQITGDVVAEAHVSIGPDGKPIVEFTWTPEGREQFTVLSRENVGRRLAVIANGVVVSAPVVKTEMQGNTGMIVGNFTEAQARDVAAAMMAGRRPGASLGTRSAAAGEQKNIERLVVEGTSRIAPAEVIARISPMREGAAYDPTVADASLRALFESGLFSNVRLTFDPATSTLRISVVER
jgi:hypothetical protein